LAHWVKKGEEKKAGLPRILFGGEDDYAASSEWIQIRDANRKTCGVSMQNVRIIAIIGLVALGLVVAGNNAIHARSRSEQEGSSIDTVSKWEARIHRVLAHLPSDANEIGYVADWDIPGMEYDLVDQETEYTLTQYALAPRMVQPGLDHEWIIGNFTSIGFRDWLDKNLASYEIIEMGFGIYLIHNTS
jgi:hypothetical protein